MSVYFKSPMGSLRKLGLFTKIAIVTDPDIEFEEDFEEEPQNPTAGDLLAEILNKIEVKKPLAVSPDNNTKAVKEDTEEEAPAWGNEIPLASWDSTSGSNPYTL